MDKEQKFMNDFINEVNKKVTEYWDKYGDKPNHIMLSKALLIRWKLNVLSVMGMPLEDINTIYGMKVRLTNKVEKIKDIQVWYEEMLEM